MRLLDQGMQKFGVLPPHANDELSGTGGAPQCLNQVSQAMFTDGEAQHDRRPQQSPGPPMLEVLG